MAESYKLCRLLTQMQMPVCEYQDYPARLCFRKTWQYFRSGFSGLLICHGNHSSNYVVNETEVLCNINTFYEMFINA